MSKHNTNNLLEKNLRFIEGLHATPPPEKRTKLIPPPPPRRPQRQQMPHLRAPVARSPVQIFTSHHEARQAAQQGNIVIPTYIAITPSYINRFSPYQTVQVSNMFGGRRSRKRNNKKRNIKTKKQYQS
jgi:hypothetical protein